MVIRTRTILAITTVAATLGSTPAWAEETLCTGFIGAKSLDNIFVPDGATCRLESTRAEGSVVVGTGATLHAKSVRVNGNVQAEGAAHVGIAGASNADMCAAASVVKSRSTAAPSTPFPARSAASRWSSRATR